MFNLLVSAMPLKDALLQKHAIDNVITSSRMTMGWLASTAVAGECPSVEVVPVLVGGDIADVAPPSHSRLDSG